LKKTLLVAAAAAAALSLPALAQAQDGYLDLSYSDSSDADLTAINVGGAVTADVGGAKLQFNVNHTRAEDDSTGLNLSATTVAAHAYKQNEQYAIGGFVTGTDVAGFGVYGLGAGGSYYLDNLTLGAVVSYNTVDNISEHYYTYGVNGRYFFTENFVAGASFDKADFSSTGDDADIWGAEVEYKFEGPVSIFASYNKYDDDFGDEDTWGLGARYYFGGKSLKEQERSGAKAMRTGAVVF
jgi:hypothetical protein